jgi:hypothetical protein
VWLRHKRVLRANVGQSLFSGSGSGANATAAIPEPTTLVTLIVGATIWSFGGPDSIKSAGNSSPCETRQQSTVVAHVFWCMKTVPKNVALQLLRRIRRKALPSCVI